MRAMTAGQRVLIVGTGPSAKELGRIPRGVRIFTCKDGLRLFAERDESHRVDVYSCIRSRLLTEPRLAELFRRTRPTVFMVNDLAYVRRQRELRGLYSTLIYDSGSDNALVRRLIHPLSIRDIRGRALRAKISTGMRLLHYAIFFGAAEIYLLGIDLGYSGYVWGCREVNRPWNHADIDENFLRAVSRRRGNLFSISRNSPIAAYLPTRRLSN
jgi:hypothetical protein